MAHGRSHSKTTKYRLHTQSLEACWEELPTIEKITLLQFDYEFGHENFSTVCLHNILKIFIDGKKIVIN